MTDQTPSSKIQDAISRIRSGFYSGLRQPSSAKFGSLPFTPSPAEDIYTPPTQEQKAPPVLQGGINLVTGILRGVTSTGRANTNIANDVLPYANRVWNLLEDGLEPDEYWDALGNAVGSIGAIAQGGLKGLAYSFMEPTEDTREQLQRFFGGEKPVEMGYELFQTEGFKEAARNIPALEQVRSEEKIGEIGIPFTEWKFDVTPAGLYGFGWDVLTDPFSFATMGFGGAAKGLARGVSAATKGQKVKAIARKAGTAPELAELPASAIPRPFYAYGDKAEKLAPAGVSYNVLNTSIPGYILREMGRGFIESHKRALLAAGSRRAAKSAKKEMTLSLGRQIAEYTEKNGLPPAEDIILAEFVPLAKSEIFERSTKKLKEAGATNPSNLDSLMGRVDGQINEAVKSLVKDDVPLIVDTLVNNAAKVMARATEDNIPYVKAAEYELADRYAQQIPAVKPAIPKTKAAKYDTEGLEQLANNLIQTTDPSLGSGEFGKAWDDWATGLDKASRRAAIEAIIMPIGYRTEARAKALGEVKQVAEAVTGTKKVRTKTAQVRSPEMKQMQGMLAAYAKQTQGAGSERLGKAGKGYKRPADADIMNAPDETMKNLARELGLNTLAPNDELRKQVLDLADNITGEMLQRAASLPILFGQRIRYMMERDAGTATERSELVRHLEKNAYNPLTAELGTPKLRQFATTADEIKARKGDRVGTTTLSEATALAVRATGKYIPEELQPILSKLGVKGSVLASADSPGAVEEIMHAAYLRKYEAKVKAELRSILTKSYGDLRADELIKQKDMQIDPALMAQAEQKAAKAFNLSDQDIKKAIELASEMKDEQLKAIDKLQELGFSVNSLSGRLLIETLGAREIAAMATRRAKAREGVAESRELRQIRIIKESLGVPAIPAGQTAELRPLFEEMLTGIKKKFDKDAPEPKIRELSKELTSAINEELKKAPTGNVARVRAIFARLGNIVKRYEDTMGRGSIAGFDFAFARKAGEYDTQGLASFIARAYSGSTAKGSIDNGAYADYIDSLLAARGRKPLSQIKLHKDKVQEVRSIISEYGGEGITPAVLVQLIRSAENVGTKGTEKVSGNKLFVEDLNRMLSNYYDNLEQELIDSGRVTPPSGSVGWITRLPAKSEQDAARASIAGFEVELPEQVLSAFNKKLSEIAKAQPENYKLIAKALGAQKLKPVVTYKQMATLQQLAETSNYALDGQLRRAIDFVVGRANESAVAVVAKQRANVMVKVYTPDMVKKDQLLAMADKVGRRENAYDAVRAKLILATMITKADIESSFADSAVSVLPKLQKDRTAAGLKKEQERLASLVRDVDAKYAKEGYEEVTDGLMDKSFDEVLAMGNPRAVLMKIRTMRIATEADRQDWQLMMKHLQNMTVTGKGKAYRNYKELLDSYRQGQDLQPGQINPITGLQVPSEAEVLETLRILGGNTAEKAEKMLKKDGKVQRKSLLNLLDQADEIITKEELQRVRANDYIRQINIAGGDDVRQAVEELPSAKEIQNNAVETLTTLLLDLERQGLGWISTLAMRSIGASTKQFFTDRFDFLKYSLRDSAGRIVDADAPTLPEAEKVLKRTWEDLTNYTGWKKVLQTLGDMADQYAAKKSVKMTRAQWLEKHVMLTLRVRDAYLLARGIVPQHSISLKRGEAKSAKIESLLKEDRDTPLNVVTVYLTEADVLDIFPAEVRQTLLFSGRENSIPPTSFLPGARLLVAAIADLPQGSWFNREQLTALVSAMREAMYRDILNSSVSERAKVSLAALEPQAVNDLVNKMVEYMVTPENGMKLFDQHVMNATIAQKLLKYRADEIAEPIMSAWRQVVESPISAAGDKMQATIDAFAELRKVLGQEDLAPEQIRLMATLDSQVLLANEIDLDSFVNLQEAYKIGRVGKTADEQKAIKSELAQIKKVQAESQPGNKEYQKVVANALLQTAEARTQMIDNIYLMQLSNLVNNGPRLSIDEQFDVFNEVYSNVAFYNHALAFTDKWLERFFYDYKMENLRNIYGGIERDVLEQTEEYTNIISRVARTWQQKEAETGINYPARAFKIIQQIPEEKLPKIMLNADILSKAVLAKSRGAEFDLDPAAVKEMFNSIREDLAEYFPADDPLLLQAAVDLWSAGGHLFGGGALSKIARSGLPPRWINFQIQMFGSSEAKEAITETGERIRVKDGFGFDVNASTPAAMANIWREDWDIESPFQMFVGLNGALSRGAKVPMAAMEVMRTYGVKLADFKQENETIAQAIARAKSEGLVKIVSQDRLTIGRELIYFMDTDNFLYPREIAQELGTFSKFLTEPMRGWEGLQKALRTSAWQNVQNVAKQFMTILRPGNWLMNFNGGLWTNFKFGVNSPVPYARALKMFQAGAIDLKKIGLDPQSLEGAMVDYFARRADEGLVVKASNNPIESETMDIVINGKVQKVSYADLWELYKRIGARVPTAQSKEYDLLGEMGAVEQYGRNLSNKDLTRHYKNLLYRLGRWAAVRDDYIRATLWIDEISKNSWPSLDAAAREALKKIDRAHPQMQDLSKFNSNIMRQMVLFFTWRAKTFGWIMHDILDRPGRIIVPLKAQYNFEQMQGDEPEAFGSFDVKGMPIRSFQQNSMDLTTPNNQYSFSLANPVTDLLGSSGWLSGISYNSYDSIAELGLTSGLQTIENFLYSSTPLIATAVLDWGRGKTSGGQDLTRNGISVREDVPLFIEDIMGQLGWGPAHIVLAQVAPDVFRRSAWEGKDLSKVERDSIRTFVSWALGVRPRELDTVENRQKALTEIFSKIAELQRKELPR